MGIFLINNVRGKNEEFDSFCFKNWNMGGKKMELMRYFGHSEGCVKKIGYFGSRFYWSMLNWSIVPFNRDHYVGFGKIIVINYDH